MWFFLLDSTAAAALQYHRDATCFTAEEIKYAVKVKATENNPTRSVTEFHWTTLSKKFKPNNVPLYSKQ